MDEQLAGKTVAVAPPGPERNRAVAEVGDARVDLALFNQFSVFQFRHQQRNMAAQECRFRVAKHLLAGEVAVLNQAPFIQKNGCRFG